METTHERDLLKELEEEKQRLESVLAQSQLKIMPLEKLIEVAEQHYRVDLKNHFGTNPANEAKGKPD